ncbi:CHAP domain-containing protein [Pedobacter sp.]|uniref:CHAP domain-containing protein n=1 Tax=Pedobacter sp. TaxID=1411316 RepID=UPI0031DD2E9E
MAKNLSISISVLLLFFNVGFAQQRPLARENIRDTYQSQIGVRELTGRNDGVAVSKYLSYVWLKPGNPWCAAFVSWTLGQNGISNARSGGCVQLMEQGRIIYRSGKPNQIPQMGDVFFIYFAEKKRVAHTGFVDQWGETSVLTVEGNTNEAGSREGDGVYRKRRLKKQIYAVTTYIY